MHCSRIYIFPIFSQWCQFTPRSLTAWWYQHRSCTRQYRNSHTYIYIYIYIYILFTSCLHVCYLYSRPYIIDPRTVALWAARVSVMCTLLPHDDVIKWKHFPRYWPFVRGIHRSPVNSPHKGQWRGALTFSLIWAWINGLWGWWFETPSCPLWLHCHDTDISLITSVYCKDHIWS